MVRWMVEWMAEWMVRALRHSMTGDMECSRVGVVVALKTVL